MGKVPIITSEQKIILDEIRKNEYLRNNFYFTGGTALSAVYLHHRYSDDLDFFTPKTLDTKPIADFLRELARRYSFTYRTQTFGHALFCTLHFPGGKPLKVDFSTYPYQQLEKEKISIGIKIDSLLDIAVNKLSLLSQRIEVKDFVDLYFLLHKFSLWDLIEGVRVKFNMEIEPFLLASDFLKVEDFPLLPRMIKPLTLSQLKKYFRSHATSLAKKTVTR